IERAIEINGAEVARNIAAFRWGRYAAINPEAVRAAVEREMGSRARQRRIEPPGIDRRVDALLAGVELPEPVRELARTRANELLHYQDLDLAREYVAFV